MNLQKIRALALREWLQHRTMWLLLVVVPFALAALALAFGKGSVEVDEMRETAPEILTTVLTAASVLGSSAVMLLIVLVGSAVIVAGLARRDHGDRSVEYWLSLPTSHGSHFGVPLVVHGLLAPLAALVIGWCLGWLLSIVVVARVVGLEAWFAQPFGQVLPAALALLARGLAGVPLAMAWLAPMLLLIVLLNAHAGRWALGLFALIIGLGGLLFAQLFGRPVLPELAQGLFERAAVSLIGASGGGVNINPTPEGLQALAALPGWAARDLLAALAQLASPWALGAALFAAACFWGLLLWRRRGAGA